MSSGQEPLRRYTLVLDAMGGDHAPEQIVKGALLAAPELQGDLILVGNEAQIREFLPEGLPGNISIVHTVETVGMEEKPTEAYRTKKESSLMVAVKMVGDGLADVVISAGNTGAANAFCTLAWRQLPGVRRPAIASRMPSRKGGFALLDCGASPDADPEDLISFAIMGRSYAQTVMGRSEPKVHLLNIGEEPGKGNSFAQQAFKLLEKYPWFAGNIEGKDIYSKPCDVVVCDAFVGNVVLKTSEGLAEAIISMLKEEIPINPIERLLYWPVSKVTAPLRKEMDYAAAGGAPLLGLNGLCMICHGRSDARAIKNALLMAQKSVQQDLKGTIRRSMAEHQIGNS